GRKCAQGELLNQVIAIRSRFEFTVDTRTAIRQLMFEPYFAGVFVAGTALIDFRYPRRQRVEVVCAADKIAGVVIEPVGCVGAVTRWQNRRAVLDRNSNDLATLAGSL